MESKELNQGRAGQYLTLADLLLAGYSAFPTAEGMNYDIIVMFGEKPCRLQVKTTQGYRNWARSKTKTPHDATNPRYKNAHPVLSPSYFFSVRRAGKGGKRLYQIGEFDGFALVTLDTRSVFYMPFIAEVRRTVSLRTKAHTNYAPWGRSSPYIEDFTLGRFMQWFSPPAPKP